MVGALNLAMEIIVQGRGFQFVILLMTAIFLYIAYRLLKMGKEIYLRRLPAIDAIEEAIGRAAEMGKPAHYTYGAGGGWGGGLASHQGPQVVASSAILGYVAQLCARYDVRLIVNMMQADAIPLTEEVIRLAYLREGKPEKFDPKIINYFPGQSPMVTGILGTFQRERPAASFHIGGLYYESVVIGEAAKFVGAFLVAGTANTHQLAFIVATSDYVLIGEELYAAAAYISREPMQVASIASEDWVKFILMAITVIGMILESAGIHVISNMLKW
ncbi:MAG: hypothetical protein DRJ21_01565 [Candidatus Methanomethylicota archaeon]|uniref:DUF6754 domain-containing protein n=1 Tax=Thermoproteota archaeon TaxID=2056631 RepID=A0A497EU63_9CREN|nr:MAG: hypothetical protein DRJ21_01565 [Candidatus Verstraetearchaeota archaeon]